MNRRNILTVATLGAAVAAVPAIAEGTQDMTGWHPIASAPKDGTNVLLFLPAFPQPVHVGHWIDAVEIKYGKIIKDKKSWRLAIDGPFFDTAPKRVASHWMPLPSSPVGPA